MKRWLHPTPAQLGSFGAVLGFYAPMVILIGLVMAAALKWLGQ